MKYRLRAATGEDGDFLYRLHVATMKEYVAQTWGWDDAAQETYFRANSEVSVAVIEILPQHQRRGLGSAVVKDIVSEAKSRGLPVTLQVLKVNPARKLYERLGFRIVGETETHYRMSNA